jgi:putative Mg2+ transporter-C (MgtC) family protein
MPLNVNASLDLPTFCLNVAGATVMGVVLGLERQYRGHPAGLRTNALVCLGATMFVSLSRLTGDSSPTRIAAYIVSGVGFLGGGVIIREGLNVRGMNTAATLWGCAAVGTLIGAGFFIYAAAGMAAILAVHVGLRPVAHWIDEQRKTSPGVEVSYRLTVQCDEAVQTLIRTIILRHVNAHAKLSVQGIQTRDEEADRVTVTVDVFASERNDRAMEEVVERLNIEPGVRAVSWEKAH